MSILTIPLSLKDIQANYNTKIIIDYAASTLKTKFFFTYLKNLNMDYDIIGLEKLDINEKKELLLYFIDSPKLIIKFPIVLESYYALLFTMLNIEAESYGFLSKDECLTLLESANELKIRESFLFLTFCYPLALALLLQGTEELNIMDTLRQAPKLENPIEITGGMVSLLYASEWGLLVKENYPVLDLTDYVVDYENQPLHQHIFNDNNNFLHFLIYSMNTLKNEKGDINAVEN